MQEIWKDIPGYETRYQVSDLGRVKSLGNGKSQNPLLNKARVLKFGTNRSGYTYVNLCKDGKATKITIHRLVALAFIPNPENKLQINHKNGVKNDNRSDNLEWCTMSENQIHRYKVLGFIQSSGEDNKRSKAIDQYDLEGKFIKTWHGLGNITRTIGINRSNISSCCQGKYRYKTAGGFIWKYHK